MPILVCPTCHTKFDSEKTAAMPFCSERCRLIDLSRWLNESYSLPVDPEAEVDEPPPDADGDFDAGAS